VEAYLVVAHGATSGGKEEEWLQFEVVRRKKRWPPMGVFPLFFFLFFFFFVSLLWLFLFFFNIVVSIF
jgi:hypothetical protein